MQVLMHHLIVLMPLLSFASANPVAQTIDDLSIDAFPPDSTDTTLIAPTDDSWDAAVPECQLDGSKSLSDGDMHFGSDENTMRKRNGAVCRPRGRMSTPSTPQRGVVGAHLKPVIRTPLKPSDRCPHQLPMFLSCGGPEVLETDPVSDKRIIFYMVVNCVQGK